MIKEKDLKSGCAKELYRTYFWFMRGMVPAPEVPVVKQERTDIAAIINEEIAQAVSGPVRQETPKPAEISLFSEPKQDVHEGLKQNMTEGKKIEEKQKTEGEHVRIQESLTDIITGSATLMSNPYIRGDNILLEALEYFECNMLMGEEATPVIEERPNCLIAAVAVPCGLSTLIQGKSRNSKSLIMDKLFKLMPSYTTLNSGSEKGIIDLVDEINKTGAIYMHEFQETVARNPLIKEAVKHFSENKEWCYTRNGETFIFKKGIKIGSTGADESKKIQDMDVEVLSRFIILRTRDDSEKYKAICEYQDKRNAGEIKDKSFTKERFERLKSHIKSVSEDNLTSAENPFAVYFGKEYLPETQKSVHYRTIYNSLIKNFAKFDKPNRIKKSENKLLVNLADIYLAYNSYYKTYCGILESLAAHSFEAISKNLNEIDSQKEKEKYERELSLIKEKQSKPINWQEIWNNGYETMKRNNPSLLDKWVNIQSKDRKVFVYNPVMKRDMVLCDAAISASSRGDKFDAA